MMSSEISIDTGAPVAAPAPLARPAGDDGFRPWHFFVLASILLATVAVILARQSSPAHLILVSFTIAAAGAAAGAFYRMLVPLTAPVVLRTGEPVSERTRAALEREKLLVLRTIKELEFDRSMGKLSQKDFEEMSGRLRTRALSLMKQLDLDTTGYRSAIEQELAQRVQKGSKGSEGSKRSEGSKWSEGSKGSKGSKGSEGSATVCVCGTLNDVDAVFCKKCGSRLQSAGAATA